MQMYKRLDCYKVSLPCGVILFNEAYELSDALSGHFAF